MIHNNLVTRYARAYLATYGATYNESTADIFRDISYLVRERRLLRIYLVLSVVPSEKAVRLLLDFMCQRGAPQNIQHLLILLASHHRLYLIGDILETVARLLLQCAKIEDISVVSVVPLAHSQRVALVTVIERIRGVRVRLSERYDPSLIAGLRIEGEEFIWEQSMQADMRKLALVK